MVACGRKDKDVRIGDGFPALPAGTGEGTRQVQSNRYPPIHPRLSHDLNNLMRNPEFKKSMEDLIALQITMHLAKEATDKGAAESKKEAPEK